MEKNDLVFVYGTLKKGEGNSSLLSFSEFLGERTTKEGYLLVASGFPFMVPRDVLSSLEEYGEDLKEEWIKPVKGHLFRLDSERTLGSLDMLEGEGHFYHRRQIELSTGETAWAYLILDVDTLFYFGVTPCATTDKGEWVWL